MTTFHTYDDPPCPSDFELEAADNRNRAKRSPYPYIKSVLGGRSDRALVVSNITDASDGTLSLEARIVDTHLNRTLWTVMWRSDFDQCMRDLDNLIAKHPGWLREAEIAAEDARDEQETQQDALS